MRSTAFRWLAALAMAALMGGCGPSGPKFQASDITGSSFARDFALTDHNGKARKLADFRGKAVAIFFGYTQCPDYCPTTLSALAEAMKRLGPDADRVQVLFVTLDPERDTPELLREYITSFDPRFLALRGDAEATAATAKEFKVVYQKVAGPRPGAYTLDHSAATYLYDPQGRLRLYVGASQGVDTYVHDLRALLHDRD